MMRKDLSQRRVPVRQQLSAAKTARLLRVLVLSLVLCASTACENGFQTLEAGQYGVVFVQLPRWLGGGVREAVIEPGEMEFIYPWQTLYRVDTTYQVIGWGAAVEGSSKTVPDYVETRTVDGNEVGLAISVRYHIDPKMVRHVIQKVAVEPERVQQIVAAVALADIRTHMNVLNTRDFFTQEARQAAVESVRKAMATRLEPEGIIVDAVIYKDHRFERAMGEGKEPDRRYQEQIDETQAKYQETEQEEKRRAAIIQAKGKEKEMEQAKVNRMLEWAKGYRRQAAIRGDSYEEKKKNEAAQILAAGLNEVEGMKKRIEALSGPGGEALLRLEIARALGESMPKFVLLNTSAPGGNDLGVTRIDTNELMRQAGIFSALEPGPSSTPSTAVAQPAGAAASGKAAQPAPAQQQGSRAPEAPAR